MVSVPSATELACMVAVSVADARSVIVTEPPRSPASVTVKSSTLKSNVPSLSWYATAIPLSVLEDTIAPTMSCTRSALRVTAPLETVKSVESKEATPLLLSVASSALMVTAAVSLPEPLTLIPSPAATVAT